MFSPGFPAGSQYTRRFTPNFGDPHGTAPGHPPDHRLLRALRWSPRGDLCRLPDGVLPGLSSGEWGGLVMYGVSPGEEPLGVGVAALRAKGVVEK
jgi:hypothetical protein